jgi:hypothetical protein
MPRENQKLADQVAASMNAIMESEQHRSVFAKSPDFRKFAAEKSEEEKEKDEKDEKEEKDEDKKEKPKKGKLPPWLQKGKKDKEGEDDDDCGGGMKSASRTQKAVLALSKVAEFLDNIGLEKSAYAATRSLQILVAEAAEELEEAEEELEEAEEEIEEAEEELEEHEGAHKHRHMHGKKEKEEDEEDEEDVDDYGLRPEGEDPEHDIDLDSIIKELSEGGEPTESIPAPRAGGPELEEEPRFEDVGEWAEEEPGEEEWGEEEDIAAAADKETKSKPMTSDREAAYLAAGAEPEEMEEEMSDEDVDALLAELAGEEEEGEEEEEPEIRSLMEAAARRDTFVKKAKKGAKKGGKVKARNRGSCVFPSTHGSVKDNKDHFPINSESQARNALARASQYGSKPPWYSGSLQGLVSAVRGAVHRKYPSIKVTEKSKNPKKGSWEGIDRFLSLRGSLTEVMEALHKTAQPAEVLEEWEEKVPADTEVKEELLTEPPESGIEEFVETEVGPVERERAEEIKPTEDLAKDLMTSKQNIAAAAKKLHMDPNELRPMVAEKEQEEGMALTVNEIVDCCGGAASPTAESLTEVKGLHHGSPEVEEDPHLRMLLDLQRRQEAGL